MKKFLFLFLFLFFFLFNNFCLGKEVYLISDPNDLVEYVNKAFRGEINPADYELKHASTLVTTVSEPNQPTPLPYIASVSEVQKFSNCFLTKDIVPLEKMINNGNIYNFKGGYGDQEIRFSLLAQYRTRTVVTTYREMGTSGSNNWRQISYSEKVWDKIRPVNYHEFANRFYVYPKNVWLDCEKQ